MKIRIYFVFCITILLLLNTSVVSLNQSENIPKKSGNNPDEDIVSMIQEVNEDILYDYLKNLTDFGPRFTGTDNCTLAAQYLYESLAKARE